MLYSIPCLSSSPWHDARAARKTGTRMTTLASQSAVDARIKSVCDILRRSNCASALQYIPN